MKIPIQTPEVQSWQIDGWMEQAYTVISRVKGYEGVVVNVRPGNITLNNVEECKLVVVRGIPTQNAYFDGENIILVDGDGEDK